VCKRSIGFSIYCFFREYILDPGYYPIRGMQFFSDSLKDKFISSGGRLLLNNCVKRIITTNHAVKGVCLEDGKEISSRYIISNADAFSTFHRLLDIEMKEKM